jgi:3D (Asp-Asp-Asp) domain-containing protein
LRRRMIIPILMLSLLVMVLFPVSNLALAAANLSWGSQGAEVVQVQQVLNNQGYWCGTADGIFGSLTYQAVIRLQRDNALSADGIVGPSTRQAMGLQNDAVSRSGSTVSRSGTSGRVLTMVATAYDGCYECNKPYYGYPSYIGLPLARGIVAVDPKVIPMGTRLYVEGYGNAIAADQGNAIKGNRIDLFFDTHQQALNYGMKTVKVTILD